MALQGGETASHRPHSGGRSGRIGALTDRLPAVALALLCVLGLMPGRVRTQAEAQPEVTRPADQEEQPNAETLLDRARAASDAGSYQQVIDLTTQWLANEPASAEGYWLRGMARAEGQRACAGAVADLAQVNRLAPELADAWGDRGWYLILRGRWAEAQKVAAKAQALDPDDYAWALKLGHTYLLQGEREQAQHWYRRTLPLIPDEASLRSGPLADLDLFLEPGWQVETSRAGRDWFEARL